MPYHAFSSWIDHFDCSFWEEFCSQSLMLVIYHTGTAFVFKTHWVRQHKVPPEAWHLDLSLSVLRVPQVMVCNVLVAITSLMTTCASPMALQVSLAYAETKRQTRFVHNVATSAPMLKKLRRGRPLMVIELPESGGSLPTATSFSVKMKCKWEIASQDHARSSFGKKPAKRFVLLQKAEKKGMTTDASQYFYMQLCILLHLISICCHVFPILCSFSRCYGADHLVI